MKNVQDPLALRIAAISGFLVVAIGAFGAHGLNLEGKNLANFNTGVKYHMFQTALILALIFMKRRAALWASVFGIAVFSGCLYAMAMGAPRFLGAIVPLGGLSFLFAWGSLLKSTAESSPETGPSV